MSEKKKGNKFIVILELFNEDVVICEKVIENCFTSLGYKVYYIMHDKDVNEQGEIKRKHFHLVVNTGKRRISKLTLITEIVLATDGKIKDNQITLDYCVNYRLSFDYLVHKNDLDKYQYSIDKIKTNDLEGFDYIKNYVLSSCGVSTNSLIQLVKDTNGNKIEILNQSPKADSRLNIA